MKNFAARVFGPVPSFLLALLSVSMAIPACATAYDKCVKPEITAAVKLAPADLLKEVSAFLLCAGPDLPDLAAPCAVNGLASLAEALGPGGKEAVDCLVSYLEGNATDPALKARAKAVGAKRGVTEELFNAHACNGLQMRAPHAPVASIATGGGGSTVDRQARGDAPGAAHWTHASCDVSCGGPKTGLATSSGCSCWRASKTNWRDSRWVALAGRSPPAIGAGAVGGGGV